MTIDIAYHSTTMSESMSYDAHARTHPSVPEHEFEATNLSIIEQGDLNYATRTSGLPPDGDVPVDPNDYLAMRERVEKVFMKLPRKLTPPGIRSTVIISSKHVPIRYGLGNQFSVHVYTPTAASIGLRPSLIMFHGGGWTHGTPEMDEELARLFASELRAVVINVDYRLAPEHPFPEPLNDCYTALDWAINNATEYMIDTARIGLWGFSSGGNLAAAVALKDSIEQPVPRVKHVSLVAPVTCHPDLYPPALRSNGSSAQTFGQGGSVPSTIAMCKFWWLYANTSFSHPYASILLADPPKHHPPVHISVAARDMLRDEGIAYALRLRNRGIDTQLEVIPGVPHEFILWPDTIVSKQFVHCQVKVLDYALNCQV